MSFHDDAVPPSQATGPRSETGKATSSANASVARAERSK